MRSLLLSLVLISPLIAAPTQEEFYLREEIPLPKGEVMEIGSIALMPDQKVAVTTRRGDLWICEGAYADDLSKVKWTLAHRGLHEPLGMFYQDGSLILTQRPEVSKLTDTNNDGKIDSFETICADWGINGDYHEYAFGSTPDKDGNVWAVLCLTGSFNANSAWRGWCVRITPDGEMIPTCSGIRSPGGIGFNAEGDTFYTDNQGVWNGSSSLKWLKPGSFQGNPTGNIFYPDQTAIEPLKNQPKDGSRINIERERIPKFIPPAVVLPHGKVGQSPTAIIHDQTAGKFGPFVNQVFVGEQTHSEVQRVFLEKVNGIYQGAVIKCLSGFRAGIIPMRLSDDGTLFIGGSNRGWASRGGKPFTFERVRSTGKTPFEILEMRAKPDGFELTFTEAVDPASIKPDSFSMAAWTYIYQSKYGSPEVDQATPVIKSTKVSPDGKSARLIVDGLVKGHVHHLISNGVRSSKGSELWHKDAYYTLNEIPD